MKVSSGQVSYVPLGQSVQESNHQGYIDKIEHLFKRAYEYVEEGEIALETIKIITEKILNIDPIEGLQKSREELLRVTGDDRFLEVGRVIACYIKRYFVFYLNQEEACKKEELPSWMLRFTGENGLTLLGRLLSYAVTHSQNNIEDVIEHNILLLFQRVFKRLQNLEDGNPYIILDMLLKAFSVRQNKEKVLSQSIGKSLLDFSFPEGKEDLKLPIEHARGFFYALLEKDVFPELVEDFFMGLFNEKNKQNQALALLERIEGSLDAEIQNEQYVDYPKRVAFQEKFSRYVIKMELALPKSIARRITNQIADFSIQYIRETKLTALFSQSLFSSLLTINPGGEWKERKFIMAPSVFNIPHAPLERDKVYNTLSRILEKRDFFESFIIRHIFKIKKPKNPRDSFVSIMNVICHYTVTALTKLFCTVFTLSKRIEVVAKKIYISIVDKKYDRNIEEFTDAVCIVLSKSSKVLK